MIQNDNPNVNNVKKSDLSQAATQAKHTDSLLDGTLISILKNGGVAVIPTDTLYGIVGRANMPATVQRIRGIKHRDDDQAFIVLCADRKQVKSFGVSATSLDATAQYWPGKVSIILETDGRYPEITGKLSGIAFRVPDNEELRALLKQTGPIVAPSANPKGQPPSMTVEQAKIYFQDLVEVYVDGGTANSKPSTLITISPSGEITVLRP